MPVVVIWEHWCDDNDMLFSASNCAVLEGNGHPHPQHCYTIGGSSLPAVGSIRDLKVVVVDDLNSKKQVDNIVEFTRSHSGR